MICKDMIYVEPREVNVTVVATHEELEVGVGRVLSLFLPLQRTGICASLFPNNKARIDSVGSSSQYTFFHEFTLSVWI